MQMASEKQRGLEIKETFFAIRTRSLMMEIKTVHIINEVDKQQSTERRNNVSTESAALSCTLIKKASATSTAMILHLCRS